MVQLSRRQVLAAAALGGAALLGPFSRSLSRESAAPLLLHGVFRVDNGANSAGRMGDAVFLSARSDFSWPSGSTVDFGGITIPAAQCTPSGNVLLFRVPAHVAGTVRVIGRAGHVEPGDLRLPTIRRVRIHRAVPRARERSSG